MIMEYTDDFDKFTFGEIPKLSKEFIKNNYDFCDVCAFNEQTPQAHKGDQYCPYLKEAMT